MLITVTAKQILLLRFDFQHLDTRHIALIKKLCWKTVEHYQQTHPKFFTQGGRSYFRLPRRFKRAIRAIDSTTIELIAKCMDWAKHRKPKAAAKVHVALDLISFIPIRVVTDSANHHDGSYMMKGALWVRRSVSLIVSRYGTAGESPPEGQAPLTPDLPGINLATVL